MWTPGDDIGHYRNIMDVVYNIGDAINKIGFGLVIYSLAVSSREEAA